MTKKKFWQTASNWGFLGGAALFLVALIIGLLKLEQDYKWLYELLMFIVLCPLILYTGKRNAAQAGTEEGYSYGRAIGFVFAMMMFAGVVFGIGKFLIYNFIAPEYYKEIFENSLASYYINIPQSQLDMMLELKDTILRLVMNPFFLIFQSILELAAKGGFLGLVLCAFVYTKPDIFAGPAGGDQTNDEQQTDENTGE